MDKDHQGSDAIEDYTFSFAAPMDPEEQGNTSPYLFGTTNSPRKDLSPAEAFFSNGQLVPHSFPAHFTNSPRSSSDISRSVSWTTVSSKEPMTSSLRNSSNSSCSRSSSSGSRNSRQNSSTRQGSGSEKSNTVRKQVRFAPGVGAQKLAPPSAITSFDVSGRVRRGGTGPHGTKRNGVEKKQEAETRSWMGKSFFRPLVSACRVCHALEPNSPAVHPRVK